MQIKFHICPTCGAAVDQPCRTSSGRKKKYCGRDVVHDTRPFSIIATPHSPTTEVQR